MTAAVEGYWVDLRVCWGSQTRHKCVYCKRYLRSSDNDSTCRCGAVYRPADHGQHEIVRSP